MFGRLLSVPFVDLDRFKSVNDRYGHQAGDRVLRGCAQILQASVRGSDLVARHGGEEFIVLLPRTDGESARQVGVRILQAMHDARDDANGARIGVTVSIGLATHAPGARFATAAELLSAADHAAYAAKHQGRNSVESCDEIDLSITAIRRPA